LTIRNEAFSFSEMLEQINTMINSQCQDKGLRYECRIVGQVDDDYIGDAMKLKQVIINILGNAVKFTPEGGSVTFTVECISRFEGQSALRFTMRDTGVDSFMAKPLVPSNVLSAFQRVMEDKRLNRRESAPVELAGRRVLIAEDMEINAEILADLLELLDVESEHAENGKVAVEMFDRSAPGHYDAILMDVRMPVMDGLEATRTLRKLARADARAIPVIAMTANAFDEDVQRSLQAGMNAHLSKPVDIDRLRETLQSATWTR